MLKEKKGEINLAEIGDQPQEEKVVPEEVKIKEPYTVTQWHGLPNYNCNQCQFSTINQSEMLKHLEIHQPKTEPISVPFFDAKGKLMK